jgi:hypothetical protein
VSRSAATETRRIGSTIRHCRKIKIPTIARIEPPIRIPNRVMIRFDVESALFAAAFALIVAEAMNDSNFFWRPCTPRARSKLANRARARAG